MLCTPIGFRCRLGRSETCLDGAKFSAAGALLHKPVKQTPRHYFSPLGDLKSCTRMPIPLDRLGPGPRCCVSGIPHVCLEKCPEVAFTQLAWEGRGVDYLMKESDVFSCSCES